MRAAARREPVARRPVARIRKRKSPVGNAGRASSQSAQPRGAYTPSRSQIVLVAAALFSV